MIESKLNHMYGVFRFVALDNKPYKIVACSKCGQQLMEKEAYMRPCDGKMGDWGASFLGAVLLPDEEPSRINEVVDS
ncbi:UNVERIFIED_ORG: hypothetical protein EC838_2787 [Providencia alcalifaciens]